jgi:hypothetical protein
MRTVLVDTDARGAVRERSRATLQHKGDGQKNLKRGV